MTAIRLKMRQYGKLNFIAFFCELIVCNKWNWNCWMTSFPLNVKMKKNVGQKDKTFARLILYEFYYIKLFFKQCITTMKQIYWLKNCFHFVRDKQKKIVNILALVRINIIASIESPQIDCVEKWSRESRILKFMKWIIHDTTLTSSIREPLTPYSSQNVPFHTFWLYFTTFLAQCTFYFLGQ